MLRHSEKIAPLAAAAAALSTLLCCLPTGFAAAAAAATLSAAIAPLQPWLITISATLLVVGIVQLRRAQSACATRRWPSVAIFCVSALIVGAVVFCPDAIAAWIARLGPAR